MTVASCTYYSNWDLDLDSGTFPQNRIVSKKLNLTVLSLQNFPRKSAHFISLKKESDLELFC